MSEASHNQVVEVLLARHGRTFASEAGIRLDRNTPAPLFRLLVMSLLVSARISSKIALAATRALADAGWTTPASMLDSTWEERTRVLDRAGYARYDESTARYLERTTTLLTERYDGDLRNLREEAGRDPDREHRLLTDFTGIGDLGAHVFLRETQVLWDELDPYADERTLQRAAALTLPSTAADLRRTVPDVRTFARLVAAIVRSGLAGDTEEILAEAAER